MTAHHGGLSDEQAALLLLAAIVGRESSGLLEFRRKITGRDGGGWPSRCFDIGELAAAAAWAVGPAADPFDTYVSTAPRFRPGTGWKGAGTAADVTRAWVLSADCDDDDALTALLQFTPLPTFVVASGGRTGERPDDVPAPGQRGQDGLQAHWALSSPIQGADIIKAYKTELAAALGSDTRVVNAAGVMRVPGTAYRKHVNGKRVHRTVRLVECRPHLVYEPQDVVPMLHRPAPTKAKAATAPAKHDDDALKEIPAAEYLADLTGRRPDRAGKVRCPFHAGGQEGTPSLQVYGTTWHCFGCEPRGGRPGPGHGGDIYEAAALVAGFPTTPTGAAFLTLQRRLTDHYMRKGAA